MDKYATICSHIIDENMQICRAKYSEPLDDADSGWQFLCNKGVKEDVRMVKIWTIKKVIEYDPSVKKILDCPQGTFAIRENAESSWKIFRFEEN